MTVNFSYRAIPNLTLDPYGGHYNSPLYQNGRQNIHVSISQYLNHLEKLSWCLNIHFKDQVLQKDNNKYPNLTFDLNGAIFLNGRRNIHVLLSQFLIHVDKFCWCLNIHFLGQGL